MKRYQKPIMIPIIAIVSVIACFGIYVIGTILWASITYYEPEKKELITSFNSSDTINVDSVYSLFSWNIGYSGLGENMDFFYDGGVKVRDKKENTRNNLNNIATQLSWYKQKASFALIQEVDQSSKRSYLINQIQEVCNTIENCVETFALNYNVKYIPIPFTQPMGKVKSGLLNISKPVPIESYRYGFTKQYPWPKKVFMLNRCFLVNRYRTVNGKEFILINVHNSAFDEGELRTHQIKTIRTFILDEFKKGNYVLAGGDWNQYPPQFKPEFSGYLFNAGNIPLTDTLMPGNWIWAFDAKVPTNRTLSAPLSQDTKTQVIDFFLASPNIEVVEVKGEDLNFEFTDHNPVFLSFKLKTDSTK